MAREKNVIDLFGNKKNLSAALQKKKSGEKVAESRVST